MRLSTGPSGSAESALPPSCNRPPGDSVALLQDTSTAALCVPGSGSTIGIAIVTCAQPHGPLPFRSREVTREPGGILPIRALCGAHPLPPRGRPVAQASHITNPDPSALPDSRTLSAVAPVGVPAATGAIDARSTAVPVPLPGHRVPRNGRRCAVVSRHGSSRTSVRAGRRHAALQILTRYPTSLWFAPCLTPRVAARRRTDAVPARRPVRSAVGLRDSDRYSRTSVSRH